MSKDLDTYVDDDGVTVYGKKKSTVYEIITERILTSLQAGVIPWRKPWRGGAEFGPHNLVTGHPYRGINWIITTCSGFSDQRWLTWKQIQTAGGTVIKGEHATPIVFWLVSQDKTKTDSNGKPRKYFSARYYRVFNVSQVSLPPDWLERKAPDFDRTVTPIESAQAIVDGFKDKPEIRHGYGAAFYCSGDDTVSMPYQKQFENPEKYYGTLFHELTHSTGHDKRLKREGITGHHKFGQESYCKEELVAEMGAAYLCGMSGIENETMENSAAYCDGWLKVLRADSKLLIHAAAQAQKASDLILGKSYEKKEEQPTEE
jgi:antirestriction protein ArdC